MEDGFYRLVGANIRERRQALDWSLQSLASCLGVSYQQLQKYEKGTNRLPTHMLVTLAAKYGCSTDELCGLKEGPSTPELKRIVQRLDGVKSPAVRRRISKLIDAAAEFAAETAE